MRALPTAAGGSAPSNTPPAFLLGGPGGGVTGSIQGGSSGMLELPVMTKLLVVAGERVASLYL